MQSGRSCWCCTSSAAATASAAASSGVKSRVVSVRLGAALSAAVLVGACASASQPPLASRFVHQGVPTVDLGGELLRPVKAPRKPKADYAIRYGVARNGGTSSALEASDPQLRDALFMVRMAPSPQSHLAAAQ